MNLCSCVVSADRTWYPYRVEIHLGHNDIILYVNLYVNQNDQCFYLVQPLYALIQVVQVDIESQNTREANQTDSADQE